MRLVALTQDTEIDCRQCHAVIAEFAEQQLTGQSLPDSLQAVKQHLSVCTDCTEEYELLHKALQPSVEK